jgi:tRNA pseudouridine38-40 synthase
VISRLALGIRYRGGAYLGWQSQPSGRTVQDALEKALSKFADRPVTTVCAGRTDTGVHGLNQVVHLDPPVLREPNSWVRGTNRYLPPDIAVQWCVPVVPEFHARNLARSRRYRYVLLESAVRPSLEAGLVGWVFRPLDAVAMVEASKCLLGEHDFSAFRSADCQAPSPIKTLHAIAIWRRGNHWCFDFHGSAFLHHMIRNLMGCFIAIGTGRKPPTWMAEVLAGRNREHAAPTFPADGLYFVGPQYDAHHGIPQPDLQLPWMGEPP